MPKTLLLADDSVTIQKVVGLSFANEDVKLVTVDNGDDAVERARAIQPDLILADVVMPGLSGYEVCEVLKSDADLKHIPVLLLSGTFDPFDEQRAERAGAIGHVVKPFESQALVARVKAILAEATQLAPSPPSAEEPSDADILALDSENFESFDSAFIPDDPLAAAEIALDEEAFMDPLGTDVQESFAEDMSTYILEDTEAAPAQTPGTAARGASEQWATSSPRDQLEETVALSQDNVPFFPANESSMVTNFDESEWDVAPMDEGFEVSDMENFDLSTTGEAPTQDFASMVEPIEAIASEQAVVISGGPSELDELEASAALEVEPADGEEFASTESEAGEVELTEPLLEDEMQGNWGMDNLPVSSDEDQLAEIEPYEVETIASEPAVDVETPASESHHVVPPEVQQNIHDTLEKIAWEAFGAVTEKLIQETVRRVEAVAWEVIPQMAESLIKEEIQRLKTENEEE